MDKWRTGKEHFSFSGQAIQRSVWKSESLVHLKHETSTRTKGPPSKCIYQNCTTVLLLSIFLFYFWKKIVILYLSVLGCCNYWSQIDQSNDIGDIWHYGSCLEELVFHCCTIFSSKMCKMLSRSNMNKYCPSPMTEDLQRKR